MKENIINQLLAPYIQQFSEYVAPKAHDAIDQLQHKWETRHENDLNIDLNKSIENLPQKDLLMGLLTGLSGGGGIRGAGKIIKSAPKLFQGGASVLDSLFSSLSE